MGNVEWFLIGLVIGGLVVLSGVASAYAAAKKEG
jgi:hypothetical protein